MAHVFGCLWLACTCCRWECFGLGVFAREPNVLQSLWHFQFFANWFKVYYDIWLYLIIYYNHILWLYIMIIYYDYILWLYNMIICYDSIWLHIMIMYDYILIMYAYIYILWLYMIIHYKHMIWLYILLLLLLLVLLYSYYINMII